MPRVELLAAALAASLALGCETTPTTGANAQGGAPDFGQAPDPESPTGGVVTFADDFRIDHDDWARLGYRWDWTAHPYISPRGVLRSFTPAGDLVIAQESGSSVSVLEARSGRLLWTSQLGSRFTKFVGSVRDGDVILVSSASELFELGATTGNLISKSRFKFLVDTAPVLVGNLAVYGSNSGKLLAHNRDTGVIAWAYALDGPIETPPVLVGDEIVAGISRGGDVIFLDPFTGTSVGRAKIAGGSVSAPVADAERLYVASLDQSIYAFDALGGALAWRVRTEYPITTQPTLHDGTLYITLRDHGLTAFDAVDGSLRWRNDKASGVVIGMRDGELLVAEGERLALVDPDNGDVIRSHDFPGAVRITTDAFVDGALYVTGRTGVIVRFVPRS